MLAEVALVDILVVLSYLCVTAYLGWLGYRGTKSTTDYLVAGRKAHPFIMSLSYGATFISTSAIVGFGGVAGVFGMSLLWLTFCNIFIGIFIAFIFLGEPVRRLGHRLDAHTFPELLGRRFQNRAVQVFAGVVIALFMPLYGAAVLIGGTEFIATAFQMDYNAALLLFATLVATYVLVGGLKGVMYTDALQGVIMFIGMGILLVFTYSRLGGVVEAHQTLTNLADLTPSSLTAIGHEGWTRMPEFGFGATQHNLWWIVVSTIVLGVGIGVLAQPQLAVRFMTVKSRRELNRAVGVGGVFILAMTGVAFTTGALSNAFFTEHGPIYEGRVSRIVNAEQGHVLLQLVRKDDQGGWRDVLKETAPDGKTGIALEPIPVGGDGQWLPVTTTTNAVGLVREANLIPAVLDRDHPYLDPDRNSNGNAVAQGRTLSIVVARGISDQIIPTYLTTALPKWFGLVFLLTLLAAAMSTLSSQFHTIGTAVGRDVFETLMPARDPRQKDRTIHVVRIAILVGLVLAVFIGYYARKEQFVVSIIARATAIFFGLCAATFLPTLLGGVLSRRMTPAAALASMGVGFGATTLWLVLVKVPECTVIGLVKTSLLANVPNWPVVDPLLIGLPLSALTAVVVSLFTKPCHTDHLRRCFGSPTIGRTHRPRSSTAQHALTPP
jgi:solute:Na+ symporter, SSS family